MSPARERWLAAGLCVLGAGITLLACTQRWALAVVVEPGFPRVVVSETGRSLAPAAAGLALVALAGAVALLVVRRFGRVVTGIVLALSGVGIVVAAVSAGTDLAGAVAPRVSDAAGRTGLTPSSLDGSFWPWIAAAGGVLVAAGGALAAVRGARWPDAARRYETDATAQGAPRTAVAEPGSADDADALWKALDRGEDPTEPS